MGLGMDVGIDLGTTRIQFYVKGKGIVLDEPAIVAINTKTNRVLAVGKEAKDMWGKNPDVIDIIRPLRDGVVSDFKATEIMLKIYMNHIQKGFLNAIIKPTFIVSIPSVITQVEQKAVEDVCKNIGAKSVFLIREPIAAAIGVGIDITKPIGSMVIDIGGGTTDIAVISMCEPVVDASLKIAGDRFDEAIARYVRRKYNLAIGEKTAEELKKKIGCAYIRPSELKVEVQGRNLLTQLPDKAIVTSTDILDALEEPVHEIIDAILTVLEKTPAELMGDLRDRGIVLTGGGSKLYGLDHLISEKTSMPVIIPDNPFLCVALGTGRALQMMDLFQAI